MLCEASAPVSSAGSCPVARFSKRSAIADTWACWRCSICHRSRLVEAYRPLGVLSSFPKPSPGILKSLPPFVRAAAPESAPPSALSPFKRCAIAAVSTTCCIVDAHSKSSAILVGRSSIPSFRCDDVDDDAPPLEPPPPALPPQAPLPTTLHTRIAYPQRLWLVATTSMRHLSKSHTFSEVAFLLVRVQSTNPSVSRSVK
mmetsp:Transcript_34152/g.62463  ORF Transcript_34152/g.62463 Transcript_34152/m.62463 type:complete len:200 (+) Transcript_34152:332-931(+)